MPKEMEEALKKEAAKKGLSKERAGAFIYGTMRKTGWTPSAQKKKSIKKKLTSHIKKNRDTSSY